MIGAPAVRAARDSTARGLGLVDRSSSTALSGQITRSTPRARAVVRRAWLARIAAWRDPRGSISAAVPPWMMATSRVRLERGPVPRSAGHTTQAAAALTHPMVERSPARSLHAVHPSATRALAATTRKAEPHPPVRGAMPRVQASAWLWASWPQVKPPRGTRARRYSNETQAAAAAITRAQPHRRRLNRAHVAPKPATKAAWRATSSTQPRYPMMLIQKMRTPKKAAPNSPPRAAPRRPEEDRTRMSRGARAT